MSQVINETDTAFYPSVTICTTYRYWQGIAAYIAKEAKEAGVQNVTELDLESVFDDIR